MPKTKVEVYDKDQLIYPYIESDHVTFSNGMKVSEMLDQSISMPTITHNETSFKVGVGDSDVSSSIVDNSVSKMVIKGQTYQNILPEPSTHVLTNNKEMFKVNEGLDPNVEIVDGVSKSAILSGQTLVNLLDTPNRISTNNYEYSFSYKIKEITIIITNNTANKYPRLSIFNDNGEWNRNIDLRYTNNKVHYIANDGECIGALVFTTYGNRDTIYDYTSIDEFLTQRIMVLSGDYTNVDIPYFEGMQSVKMPVLHTVGKNLFNLPLVQGSQTYGTIGGKPTHEIYSHRVTNEPNKYIKVKPNTQITFSIINNDIRFAIAELDKNGNRLGDTGWLDTVSQKTITTKSSTHYIGFNFKKVGNADITVEEVINSNPMFEYSNTSTSYEPYKSNILHAPEEVVLRSVENVQDTINLNTGEYVQRIGEVILNGSESWQVLDNNTENTIGFTLRKVLPLRKTGDKYVKVNCDKLPSHKENLWNNDKIGCVAENNINQDLNDTQLQVRVLKSTLSTQDTNGFKSWLQTNPLTIQYILETPVVKTINLSSSGNWEKVVLDGSENWRLDSSGTKFMTVVDYLPKYIGATTDTQCFTEQLQGVNIYTTNTNIGVCVIRATGTLRIRTQEVLDGQSVDDFKQYLSQNPITVWYQTQTHQDSTQVKQPIFFKDGHIIQSSGVDSSLIPTLDYQAKTSNSYVMDLMKTNTRYTMKAKSASGTFTIDGTSYGAGTNGTFTTPSSMTNKFLVMSSKTNTEVMILEGDVTSKTIPYFKGIKSAFEGEDKIEVLSTGKNLFDVNKVQTNDRTRGAWETRIEGNKIYSMRVTSQVSGGEFGAFIQIPVKPSVEYVYKFDFTSTDPNLEDPQVYIYNNSSIWGEVLSSNSGKTTKFTTKANTQFITIGLNYRSGVQKGTEFCTYNAILIETTQARDYEPHKSNSTKIPLLSSLRSLPTEVCDEVIINREKKKATLIQRVGCVMLDGSEEWGAYPTMEQDKTLLFQSKADCKQGKSARCVSDRFPYSGSLWNSGFDDEGVMMGGGGSTYKRVDLRISKIKVSSTSPTILREYLSKNPFVVLYELETPIITEIDLEGFPYIYKDGYIFLNSEIAPITEIIYSINQCQQISASNEDIIRHEKELTYLQKLIAQYVQVDYESALLSLKV